MIYKTLANYKFKSALCLTISILSFLSLISYNSSDPSFNLVSPNSPHNILLYFGSYLSDFLYQILGLASFIIPICLLAWSIQIIQNKQMHRFWLRIMSFLLLLITASAALGSFNISYLPSAAGGAAGTIIFKQLIAYDIPGITEYITKEILILGLTLFATIFAYITLGIHISKYIQAIYKLLWIITYPIVKTGIPQKLLNKISSIDSGDAFYASEGFDMKSTADDSLSYANQSPSHMTEEDSFRTKSRKASRANRSSKSKQQSTISENKLPSLDLLDNEHGDSVKQLSKAELDENAHALVKVLDDFGVQGKMLDVKQGPVVTLYEFEPAAGTKSSRVIGLADDIARSLSALSTRIAVIPGRNALGIELPNQKRSFFRLRELIETEQFMNEKILLPLILGKDLGGKPYVADLAKMPHLLVAGTTGAGKSVAINAMIMSLLYRYRPDECKMIMIDPKMLELSAYDNIPHLLTPVVTEPGKAVVALKWAVKEMENRYRLMSHMGVRNIANYNTKIDDAIKNGTILERTIQTGFDPETGKPINEQVPIPLERMPFIVVIVDEMADLMIVAGKDIESSIQRLAQMARAAGIHIIMATQRPSVDVITGVIKANFPSRISFRVTSKIDARTILGEQGAEQLLGMGDMLFMGSTSNILRVHGPFVDDKEVERVTNFLRNSGSPDYVSAVTESSEDELSTTNNGSIGNDSEDLYSQAVYIVKTERKSSISYIQRCLRIGYNRAANLVDEMEKNGVLSPPNHSGKREILLPEE